MELSCKHDQKDNPINGCYEHIAIPEVASSAVTFHNRSYITSFETMASQTCAFY